MNLSEVLEIEKAKSEIELSYESLKLLNPFTGMLPNFSNKKRSGFSFKSFLRLSIFQKCL